VKLIPNWRSRLRDYSTIALALSAGIVAAWSALPGDWLAHLPTAWVARCTGVLSLLGLIGKFVVQGHAQQYVDSSYPAGTNPPSLQCPTTKFDDDRMA
jgi:hypothetical protein